MAIDSKKTRQSKSSVTRRSFMVGVAGLTFSLVEAGRIGASATTVRNKNITVTPWVAISTDGSVHIMSPAAEMGQGSLTSLPLILAEELDADWTKVKIVPAPPIQAIYGNPGFGGMMYTAGSAAVRGYYKPLRLFGAQVRRVLIENAAKKWGVPVEELTTEPGVVIHARSGRRFGYGEIAAFAELPAKAPDIKDSELKKPGEFRLIGKDVMRVELPSKVDGTAQYSIDVQLPRMLYGAITRAPVEGSSLQRVDDAAAQRIRGVIKLVSLPHGVGVIAETPEAAFAAKEALKITWSRDGKAWGFSSEKGIEVNAVIARNLAQPGVDWEKVGDAAAAFQQADSVYSAEYHCDYAYHAQMEPLNAVALVPTSGGAAEIWCGTQSQFMAVEATAKALGITPDKVKLHDMLLGGGFGRRGHRDEEFIVDAVLLANETRGRPVKTMWTREDDVRNGRFRPLTAHFLRAGFDKSGKLVAWHHRHAGDGITAFQDPVFFEMAKRRDVIAMRGMEASPYEIPNRHGEFLQNDSGIRTSALRGVGVGPNKFAVEAFIDELAAKRGIDPVVFRLDLLKNVPRARAVVDKVTQMSDWRRKRNGRGLGFAYMDYTGTHVATVAEVTVNPKDGEIRVHDIWTALDCGIAVQPDNVVAQTESCIVYGLGLALSERITVANGEVQESNFYDYQVPRMRDIPDIHVELVATPNNPTGVGQMATPGVAPAISNAVAAATGVRLRHMPMTPERVLRALKT
ncbi:MAG: xanthine dehydrogenase family protein molybdopterin-binding subunit [Proteobacteria bacterium]|nr:xanthine dehydrogenase family protein molybdopterin-binding subunit [Pseudomonadota bacterium]